LEQENITELKKLIDLFEHNLKQYKGKHYDEAKARADFIDKFFELLGWDVYNKNGYSEQYRDVVREDRVEIKGKIKAPDYCFRIGGVRKFFVEAKKPAIDIKHDIEPAFQLRRYAYTARLPLSILTDFEEFAVYDTRIKPDKRDQASVARIFYCTHEDYEKEFDFISKTFSREAILKGSFDQYIEDTKRKRGTSEVDKEFLKLIEQWRENLAKNIALRNKKLSIYELNYAVQKIIDRIIFLRIAEDRQIEDYGRIQKLNESKTTIYPELVKLFLQADVKYDSGLFDFQADQITPNLKIDDRILKDIFKSLYYPDSPYEFSVFDVEILGNIYEQFLGKTIRLTPGHQAKVEDKPEVKKAGGVYYTPKYIVDYIVKNTVVEKIKNKTPDQISKLKICDPACGSGSFLLGAYQTLMNYNLDYYTKDKNLKKALKENKIYQLKENEYRLTIEEKHGILLNNIFGVDIDSQAVEVTKLSLLLKLMEGESQESTGLLFKFSDIKLLPDLSDNIKCGNSLIGSDFYDTRQMSLFQDEETTRRINVFDWPQEFPDIFKSGGFDIIIGNPPYTLIGSDRKEEQLYFLKLYKMTSYKINSYLLFLEKGLSVLNDDNSYLGYIIPKSLVFNTYFAKTRKMLLENYVINEIIEIKDKVFTNAEVGDSILFFAGKSKKSRTQKFLYYKVKNIYPRFRILNKYESYQHDLLDSKNISFYNDIVKFEAKTIQLNEICKISNGLNPGNVRHILFSYKQINENYKKLLLGRDINKYSISWSGTWVNYDPNLKQKISIKDIKSKKGMNPQKKIDFALRDPKIFKSDKILIRKTADKIITCYDSYGYYFDSLSYGIQLNENIDYSILYILALLNSKLINSIHEGISKNKEKVFAKVLATNLKSIPIREIDFSNKKDVYNHDKIVSMVEQILKIQKKYHNAKTENEKKIFKKQIDILDNQINQLVDELYGLTEEEIRIVEGE